MAKSPYGRQRGQRHLAHEIGQNEVITINKDVLAKSGPGGSMRQSANQRTVDLLRRRGYLTLLNEWALGNGRIAVEYGISAAGIAALQGRRDQGETPATGRMDAPVIINR